MMIMYGSSNKIIHIVDISGKKLIMMSTRFLDHSTQKFNGHFLSTLWVYNVLHNGPFLTNLVPIQSPKLGLAVGAKFVKNAPL